MQLYFGGHVAIFEVDGVRSAIVAIGFGAAVALACGAAQSEFIGKDAGTLDAAVDVIDGPMDGPTCTEPVDAGMLGPPEVIASRRSNPRHLGISSAGVVWIERSEQLKNEAVILDSTPEPILLGTAFPNTNRLRVHRDHFAFSGDGLTVKPQVSPGVGWGSIAGKSFAFPSAPGLADVRGIALDESHFYVAWDVVGAENLVVRYQVTAPGEAPMTLYTAAPGRVFSLTVDDEYLYWFSDAGGAYVVERMPKSGGTPESLASTNQLPADSGSDFVVRDSTLFWTRSEGPLEALHVIYTVAPGMASPRVIADDPDGVGALAVDDDYAYWTSAETRIKRVRHCGGTPEIVADQQDHVSDVAVDDSGVYWVNKGSAQGTGSVMRMRKQ